MHIALIDEALLIASRHSAVWARQGQTAFLDKREFSNRNGLTRIKVGVSHTRQHAVDLSVRLRQAARDKKHPTRSSAKASRSHPITSKSRSARSNESRLHSRLTQRNAPATSHVFSTNCSSKETSKAGPLVALCRWRRNPAHASGLSRNRGGAHGIGLLFRLSPTTKNPTGSGRWQHVLGHRSGFQNDISGGIALAVLLGATGVKKEMRCAA